MKIIFVCLLLFSHAPADSAIAPVYNDSLSPPVSFSLRVARPLPLLSNSATNFELKDQYNNAHTYRFPKDKVSVLAFGDRKGSAQIEGWIRPLVERYQGRIDINGVAELSAVPALSRGIVRRIFKRQVKYPVMLDWSGQVSKGYGYRGGRAGIFVINQQGHIVTTRTGAASTTELNTLYEEINRLVK
ncbi:MAG TPA: hypothetical protein VM943_02630 [Pyrinomonadaceae bacterium]|nr:hypothetical protein [Pyrinomonadaceae bacterium]